MTRATFAHETPRDRTVIPSRSRATATGLSQTCELAGGADNTADGLYSFVARRDRPAEWSCECLDRIRRLSELPANWDSYGAHRVDENSMISAMRLVCRLAEVTGINSPRVAASPAGHVALCWEWHEQTRELDLEVLADGTLRYAYLDERDPSSDVEGETSDPIEIVHLLTKCNALNPEGWHVCGFLVSDVKEVGLDIAHTPTDRDPGHCSVTASGGLAYPNSKAQKLARRTRILTDAEIDQPWER